jgi:hypothetical protein
VLDAFGALFVFGYLGSILILALRRAQEAKALKPLLVALAIWAFAQSVLYVGARQGTTGQIPPNILMFGLTLAMLTGAWLFVPAFSRLAVATSLGSLLALNAWRLGGFFFLLLYAQGRLSAPFAPIAALGDMITGAAAAAVALALLNGRQVGSWTIVAWNVFGLADLLIAVGLALLSTAGARFQFFAAPETSAFTALPWILVPTAIVPALIFVHMAIRAKLAGERRTLATNRHDRVAL